MTAREFVHLCGTIENSPATGVRLTRARLRALRGRVSVRIAGSRTVEGSVRRRWRREGVCAPQAPRQRQRSECVSTDRGAPCAPSVVDPAWNAQHGFGPPAVPTLVTAREFVRASLRHDWQFATDRREGAWRATPDSVRLVAGRPAQPLK